MTIMSGFLMPHPPLILPEIGKGEEKKIQKTINAMNEISSLIRSLDPETIILITPHGNLFRDAVVVHYKQKLTGNFATFGYGHIQMSFDNDLELADAIMSISERMHIPVLKLDEELKQDYDLDEGIDHGALVPLSYILHHYQQFQLIHITYGLLKNTELYAFGQAIQRAAEELDKKVVVIASGDLSHRLTRQAPSGYAKEGKIFDDKMMTYLQANQRVDIMTMDSKLAEKAGECGLRSIQIMMGALDGLTTENEVLSYEGPFGVGYGCVSLKVIKKSKDMEIYNLIQEQNNSSIKKMRNKEDALVQLARKALETMVSVGEEIKLKELDLPQELMTKKSGVFVSIKKEGQLRGCIGTIEPTKDNIAQEIIANAISAGLYDPRFYPVKKEELENLVYSVDVLFPPEKITSKEQLDVEKYGVIVSRGHKKGLLLPNLDGVNSIDEQLSIALRKAGIQPWETYELQRFQVVRHY